MPTKYLSEKQVQELATQLLVHTYAQQGAGEVEHLTQHFPTLVQYLDELFGKAREVTHRPPAAGVSP